MYDGSESSIFFNFISLSYDLFLLHSSILYLEMVLVAVTGSVPFMMAVLTADNEAAVAAVQGGKSDEEEMPLGNTSSSSFSVFTMPSPSTVKTAFGTDDRYQIVGWE